MIEYVHGWLRTGLVRPGLARLGKKWRDGLWYGMAWVSAKIFLGKIRPGKTRRAGEWFGWDWLGVGIHIKGDKPWVEI